MKGDQRVIQYLNKILGNELVAINQYFLHAKMFQNWGYEQLNTKEYNESIDEMRHADLLAKRILFLDGLPNFQELGKINIGESVKEIFQCDLKLETDKAIPDLKNAIDHCESVHDFGSRDLLVQILNSEEQHADWLETQLNIIDNIGLNNYLQSYL
jgi:bacterioferritin